MKLDYKFIKEILLTMEEYDKHEISSYELWQKIGVMDSKHCIDKGLLDKFLGHIKVLDDNCCIECSNDNFGVVPTSGGYLTANVTFRLTAQGYEFLDVLKNDMAFNKIKDFAISNAIYIGKQIIVQLATGAFHG